MRYGYFDNERCEYVIDKVDLPTSWTNYLGVDDEPVIAEGLTKGIEWAKWNCKVAGTAENGEAGIKLVRQIQPDILITDISKDSNYESI